MYSTPALLVRRVSVGLVLVFAVACAARDFPADDARVARLMSDREAVWWAWFQNDTSQLGKLLAAEVVAINSRDTTWQDRAAVVASAREFAKGGAKLLRVTFPKTEKQVFGSCAVLYSTYELELEQNGRKMVQRGRATEVFIWHNGVWQNTGWHLDAES